MLIAVWLTGLALFIILVVRTMSYKSSLHLASTLLLLSATTVAFAAENDATELAKKLQNPVADIISVPFQLNNNFNVGPDNDYQGILNIQPVIPVSINSDWNLITRTILPVISQPTMDGREYGLGDIQFSALFSPTKTAGGWIWGAGAIAQLPTATDDDLGTDRWGLGPTAVALKITKQWVYGALINNVFDVGGDNDREDINQMLVQPFINYNFLNHPGRYLTFSPVITANWEASSSNTWTVPLGLGIGQIVKVGKLPINLQAAYYYNVITPDEGADYQIRLQAQLVFPR
jgi:hypothetical protein